MDIWFFVKLSNPNRSKKINSNFVCCNSSIFLQSFGVDDLKAMLWDWIKNQLFDFSAKISSLLLVIFGAKKNWCIFRISVGNGGQQVFLSGGWLPRKISRCDWTDPNVAFVGILLSTRSSSSLCTSAIFNCADELAILHTSLIVVACFFVQKKLYLHENSSSESGVLFILLANNKHLLDKFMFATFIVDWVWVFGMEKLIRFIFHDMTSLRDNRKVFGWNWTKTYGDWNCFK